MISFKQFISESLNISKTSSLYDIIGAGEKAYEDKISRYNFKKMLDNTDLDDKQKKSALQGYDEAKKDDNYFK